MALSDLSNEGDVKFIIADLFDNFQNMKSLQKNEERKIKVYKRTNMIYDFSVPERPVSLITIYDTLAKPNLPVIAVASGSSVYYFKDFSPHMKFDLPYIEFSEEESNIWSDIIKLANSNMNLNEDATESSQEIDVQMMPQLLEKLNAIRENKESEQGLSYMSARLLALESQQEQFQFVN